MAWAAFAEGRSATIADVDAERNRMARIIFDLARHDCLTPEVIAYAVGQMMRERAGVQ